MQSTNFNQFGISQWNKCRTILTEMSQEKVKFIWYDDAYEHATQLNIKYI